MNNKYRKESEEIIEYLGGADNISHLTHCMTRLRFNLKDYSLADQNKLEKVSGVIGINNTGAQYQVIIGQAVERYYKELISVLNISNDVDIKNDVKEDLSFKSVINSVFDYLSGSLTPLIPILLSASLAKTVAAIIGPSLLGLVSETSDIYTLFTFVGDAGFYFLPVFIAYSAARKLNTSIPISLLLGAVLIHPTLLQIASDEVSFSVYGIPTVAQNYTSTVVPMLLIVWILSYVDRFFDKYSPDVLKVFLKPFGSLIIMLPISLSVLAPLGGYIGQYVSAGIISLNEIAGPFAVAIIGGTFSLLVLTGMHPLLFTYLFVSFPELGYDNFLLPGILATSWAGLGVSLACVFKFKYKENKTLGLGYIITWLLGGVGEPMLYGLYLRYKTPLYACIIAGFLAGIIAGLFDLTAYVLNTSNGIYGLAAFIGGDTSNYFALGVTLVAAVVLGFVVMYFMKIDEEPIQ
ncbi:MAG: PTS transporter subunit EIIC [Bacteroidia bacterium]|nr:PTS transporter subunit EIIC [Bacteroidia bacterium]